MALQTSGAISLQDIEDEFGGSHPISINEYYDAASGIPASGEISFDDFYGKSSEVVVNASNATNVVLSSVFGSAWTTSTPKTYNVPSGVTIGATSTSNAAIQVSSGLVGTLVINVVGSVLAAGGSGGSGSPGSHFGGSWPGQNGPGGSGGNGGTAISVVSNGSGLTINNTGQISGGGGGGGGGGNGVNSDTYVYNMAGGTGGTGGNGQGYNQSASNGGSGGCGGHNAGRAAAGGNGGSFGNSGGSGGTAPFTVSGSYVSSTQCSGYATATAYHPAYGYSRPTSGGSGGSGGRAIKNDGASWSNGTTSGTYHGGYT